MKIEKLNENQIRCTLTHADLEADNIPLMIEAIPSSADSIVLIITKVEDPEELDTRFSRFTPSGESDPLNIEALEKLEGADEFLNLLNKVKEAASGTRTAEKEKEETHTAPVFSVRLFSFETLDGVIKAARLIAPAYKGANTLYKDGTGGVFLLALAPSEHSTNEFNKICNMLSEYGTPEKADSTVLAFLEEHCDIIISANAVQKLSTI